MNTLIFYAHPDTGGHSFEILQEAEKKLKDNKVSYKLYDLYRMNYDPILNEKELYTSGGKEVSDVNVKIQKEISKAENLVFIYPIWWGGMPAILKGFFDRILTSGFAFRYVTGKLAPEKLLKGKKATVFLSSGGPKIYYTIFGNRAKKNIARDILAFCGIQTKVLQLFNAGKLKESKTSKIQNSVNRGMKNIIK